MAKFVDRHGREWRLELTLLFIKELRINAEVSLGKASDADKLGETVFSDPEKMGRAFWVLCEKQAEKANLSPEEFADCFDGDTLERATLAFMEMCIDFFHRGENRIKAKAALPKILQQVEQKMGVVMDQMETLILSGGVTS